MSKKYRIEVCDEDYEFEAETEDEAYDQAYHRVEIIVDEIEEEEDA